jgi:hypothetical protein
MLDQATQAPTANLKPAHWRVLNHIFYASRTTPKETIIRQQVRADLLVDLERRGLIEARMGDEPVALASIANLPKAGGTLTIWLSQNGHHLVTSDPRNQVICLIGRLPNRSATIRHLRGEAAATDQLLTQMDEENLITAVSHGGVRLTTFRHLPIDMVVRLTAKGRAHVARP